MRSHDLRSHFLRRPAFVAAEGGLLGVLRLRDPGWGVGVGAGEEDAIGCEDVRPARDKIINIASIQPFIEQISIKEKNLYFVSKMIKSQFLFDQSGVEVTCISWPYNIHMMLDHHFHPRCHPIRISLTRIIFARLCRHYFFCSIVSSLFFFP